ncbi:MAG: type II toxin-antitoxin system HicA family toxin [Lentisphaerota bacterium]
MSRKDKLIQLLTSESQMSWSDFASLMRLLDFELLNNNGSRRCFAKRELANLKFFTHEPHPQNVLKKYQKKEALNFLKENKIL